MPEPDPDGFPVDPLVPLPHTDHVRTLTDGLAILDALADHLADLRADGRADSTTYEQAFTDAVLEFPDAEPRVDVPRT
ncbi:MAG: hypothetical protein NVV70_17070 [Cellulomonas sp.]|nr:hypothetical protein [Cellulomonas sp.]MCR6649759.1 hypothetical protein [Cellulomonas sp.]